VEWQLTVRAPRTEYAAARSAVESAKTLLFRYTRNISVNEGPWPNDENRFEPAKQNAIDEILLRSRRRCAICAAEGDVSSKIGDLAHLLPFSQPAGGEAENLVFLCADHHRALDRSAGGITVEHVREARDALYRSLANETVTAVSTRPRVFLAQENPNDAATEVVDHLRSLGVDVVRSIEPSHPVMSAFDQIEQASTAQYMIVVLAAKLRTLGGRGI